MKLSLIDSMSLPKGVPVAEYSNLPEILADIAKGKLPAGVAPEDIVTALTNKYSRQKDCLVDFRDWLWSQIKSRSKWTGYKTEKVKSGDKEITVESLPEQKNINAFVQALVDGTFKSELFPLAGIADAKARANKVWEVFQSWADEGSKTVDVLNDKGEVTGVSALPAGRLSRWQVDASLTERKSKPKTPPDYAVKNAESVWSDTDKTGKAKTTKLADRLAKWYKVFIDKGLSFDDFRAFDPKDESSVAAARTKLAWAIKADADYEREQRENANPYK